MRDVLEHVEPGDAVLGQQLRGVGLRLLQDRGADVAGFDLGALRALHVQHRGLEDAAKRRRLLRLALIAALLLLDRVAQVGVQLAAQLRQVGAAGGEDALAVVVVGERVKQMFESDIGVPPRHRFAVGDGQHDFNGGRKHGNQLTLLRSPRAAGTRRHGPLR